MKWKLEQNIKNMQYVDKGVLREKFVASTDFI